MGSGNGTHCFRDDHEVSREILQARERAHEKHGANSIESVPAREYGQWLAILGEEFGEVAGTLTYDKSTKDLRSELIDLAVVATAWIDAIDSESAAVSEPLIDPDCRDGKHTSCVGSPCECVCHD